MVIRFILAAATLLLASTPTYAYIDPGTGSMLLQGLLAAIAASMLFLRGRWTALKMFCARLFGRRPTTLNAHDRNAPPEA